MSLNLRSRTLVSFFPLVLFLAVLGGCFPSASPPAHHPEIRWDAVDASIAIEWLGEVRTPADLGMKTTFWQKLRDLVTGGSDFRLLRPYGLERDDQGRLCIVDPGARTVYCLDPADNQLRIIRETDQAPLLSPIDVAKGDDGTLYVTDSAAGTILACAPGSSVAKLLIRLDGGRPTGIAFSRRQQLLFVSDTTSHQVVAFDLHGTERFRFGTRGTQEGEFNFPTDLWVDHNDQILVTDSLNARVQIFTGEGRYLSRFGEPGWELGQFGKPKGIAVTSAGYRAVCDAERDQIQIFDPLGRPVLAFGQSGKGPGDFILPTGIFIDDDDVLWVADSFNQRVQYFQFTADKGLRQ